MPSTLSEARNFLGIPPAASTWEQSAIAVCSVPYEHTVSYGGGTGRAPQAILDASHYVEFWDEEYQRELCFDVGIATLKPLALGKKTNAAAMDAISNHLRAVLDDGKFPFVLGGEHSISAGTILPFAERFPSLSVLHFDAHSDLRESYLDNPYSHASAMARVCDFLAPTRLVQVGIRAQCREEFEMIQRDGITTFFARGIRTGEYGKDWMKKVVRALGDPVFISFDIDALDTSIMPTTGTPEPGGLLWDETADLLRLVGRDRVIIGAELVELSPDPHVPAPTYLAAKLAYKIMNAAFQSRMQNTPARA